ncbi:uncharacterized protein P884DRAFT_271961 [Thermothelomyces heterothallicus CBS 202.75]|uniref:uncharacterized protein n=1 Tax=Thermothelomyces heterothallicus CBS 202.75 TaxID=1149848 RepID=UPI003743C0EA
MLKSFPDFSRLPQEIQDDIWERSVGTTRCSQENWPPQVMQMLEGSFNKVRFVLPSPELARRSPYYHAVATVPSVCAASRDAYKRVINKRGRRALGELLAWPENTTHVWQSAENQKTLNICALPTRMTEENRSREVWPDVIMGFWDPEVEEVDERPNNVTIFKTRFTQEERDRIRRREVDMPRLSSDGAVPVFLNPATDILWLDCAFGPVVSPSSATLCCELRDFGGFFNRDLISIRRLAIEFTRPQSEMQCNTCLELAERRQEYDQWLESWYKTASAEAVCLLCGALETPGLADMPPEHKQMARNFFSKLELREGLASLSGFAAAVLRRLRGEESETGFGEFDGLRRLFARVYLPLLQLKDEIERANEDGGGDTSWSPGRRRGVDNDYVHSRLAFRSTSTVLFSCPRDFDGDMAAFYNSEIMEKDWAYYNPENYDEAGDPICRWYEGRRADRHNCEWPRFTRSIANFWPLTTPNLETLYIADRGIKLRPGASIPPELATFRGNGCVYVEVPIPDDPTLIFGGEDDVWQYPRGTSMNSGNAYEFGRYMVECLQETLFFQGQIGRAAAFGPYDYDLVIDTYTQPSVKSPYTRAIRTGEIPEVKVLAVVDDAEEEE